ncbi:hypothetical protein QR680_012359 [Steinernema hermaphroditum]|uniref:WD repeat domain phosphoinositide-interacting protein 3 n=1 Tax=Steinernema hermaphroditum TaxID=289476 RepID=A0AA39I1S8_9BILA|nr:hypothetical protein QR680_012359 [Steinernema hermaphroditum]
MMENMACGVLSVNFNQDSGCFGCGCSTGFRVYNVDPLKQIHSVHLNGGISIVEMLFRCNYIALVGGGPTPAFTPNRVVIWECIKEKPVIELELPSEVRAVRLRRDRIIAVLDSTIHVYSFVESPKRLHVLETWPNVQGLCTLSPMGEAVLAFPSSTTAGSVHVLSLAKPDAPRHIIDAHQSQIVAMALSNDGLKLATASEKGTLVRVFDTKSNEKLNELRRGTNNARIFSLNFNAEASMVCVSSDHSTIHLFSLQKPLKRSNSKKLENYIKGEVSFSRFHIQPTATKNKLPAIVSKCAFSAEPNSIVVVMTDGSYYKFHFDAEKGQCTRQTYSLFLEMGN